MINKCLFFIFFGISTLNSQTKISDDIYDALVLCYEETSENPLLLVYNNLENNKINDSENEVYKYWQSYTRMFLFTYSNNLIYLNEGKEILQHGSEIDDSEEYALMAYWNAYEISTVSKDQKKVMELYYLAKNNVEKSLQLNEKNPRALYVRTLLNYYSSNFKQNKNEIKSELERILRIYKFNKEISGKGYFEIDWGENLTYELYIRYYLKLKKVRKAKKMFSLAKEKFPNDYLINQYYYELGKK